LRLATALELDTDENGHPTTANIPGIPA
jgi:hypothetical protein